MSSSRVTRSGLAILAATGFVLSLPALAQQPSPVVAAPQAAPADPWRATVDPRVQQRTYLFTETNEQLPYALFVSSKITKDRKAPLIVALHGLGGTQNTMVSTRINTIELAEQNGYIFVSPMGYNCGGWYGMPARAPRPAGAPPTGTPPAGTPPAGAPPAAAPQGSAPQGGPPRAAGGPPRGPMACSGGGTVVTDAARVRELSEKDVLTVLDMIRKEFNVDERRIYLMGHSMGGSGTLHLGAKHPGIWAAIAADAPPGAPNAEGIAAAKMPTLVIQGDMDTAVPVAGTRRYIERLKELGAVYEYIEIAGLDHNIAGIADMYKFFEKHSKPAR
jgi:predicted esterase